MICAAQLADVPQIYALEQQGFTLRERWSLAAWEQEFADGHRQVLVERDESSVRAVATVSIVAEVAELFRIIVAASERQRGIGAALLAEAIAYAISQGATQMLIEVRADNVPAIALYRSFGFSQLSLRKDYYGSGMDALILTNTLSATGGIDE